jgi:hypothetical protein
LWNVYFVGLFGYELAGSTLAVSAKQAESNINFRNRGKNQDWRSNLEAFLALPNMQNRYGAPVKFRFIGFMGICPKCQYSEARINLLCPNCGEADLNLNNQQTTSRRKRVFFQNSRI